ncbi:MAG: hypothetical protein KF761_06220 [Salinibacterium sp.]|nr:hypothetical protein [Salinibacterium sp.]
MSMEQWGDPVEVGDEPTRGQLPRLLVALVGIGLAFGAIFGVGSWLVGTFSQTEAGLCRITVAPCAELSVASVEELSGIALPPGTEVRSGYAQELGTLHEFRAEVVLPEGGLVTMSNAYEEIDALLDLPEAARDLREVRLWERPLSAGDGFSTAVTGTRDGRTIVAFDELYTPTS